MNVDEIPFWCKPRCLTDENCLNWNLKPLFDLEKRTSLYMPGLIDLFNKSTPLYAHKGMYSARVTILP